MFLGNKPRFYTRAAVIARDQNNKRKEQQSRPSTRVMFYVCLVGFVQASSKREFVTNGLQLL